MMVRAATRHGGQQRVERTSAARPMTPRHNVLTFVYGRLDLRHLVRHELHVAVGQYTSPLRSTQSPPLREAKVRPIAPRRAARADAL